ncbi:MAG: pyridine nucleotide-disulfide oxidoreductase, partial [Actinomycetota bacterium]|nr:pyridine nucleotide-disulfide oxidoreductase [Actinomycetota bacterium]
ADGRLRRVLGEINRHIDRHGLGSEVLDPDPPPPVRADPSPNRLDLHRAGIGTVIWATGHRRAYPWLKVPVLDARGEISQVRGATTLPGLSVLGQRFQHFRNSNFIDGVGRDATYVADHLCGRIGGATRKTAYR